MNAKNPNRKNVSTARRVVSILLSVLAYIVAIGFGLVIFALFHHVLPRELQSGPIATAAPKTPMPTVVPTQLTSNTPASSPTPTQLPGWNFDAFVIGEEPKYTQNSYKSENVSIEITTHDDGEVVYYVADIYVRDIDLLKTAFADGKYGLGYRDSVANMASENSAILAVSGDYYGAREVGPVIRNGDLYRESKFRDVCCIYYDGTMKTFEKNDFDAMAEWNNGAYQAFTFGPQLLTSDGKAMTEFNSDVPSRNPRCAIGYFEPGHYCFVVVDGRGESHSEGMSLTELSSLFESLGCRAAYNLDGGQTATMVFNGNTFNSPVDGGRRVSDIVYICDP